MSRVMMLHFYCDNDAAGHPPRTVEGDTILANSPKQDQVVELEVCEGCLPGLSFLAVTDLADRFGREITPADQDPALVCPHGCNGSKPYKSAARLKTHLSKKHDEAA